VSSLTPQNRLLPQIFENFSRLLLVNGSGYSKIKEGLKYRPSNKKCDIYLIKFIFFVGHRQQNVIINFLVATWAFTPVLLNYFLSTYFFNAAGTPKVGGYIIPITENL
jgi:hypothetical protein